MFSDYLFGFVYVICNVLELFVGSMFSSHCFFKRVILIPFLKIIIVSYFLFKFLFMLLVGFFPGIKKIEEKKRISQVFNFY